MKIITNNKLLRKPEKIETSPSNIVEIILNNPRLKFYLSNLNGVDECTEIYENFRKGVEIKINSVEEIVQLAEKFSDNLVVRKRFTLREDLINSLKNQFLILICELNDKNDEILQEIYEFIEIPELNVNLEVFLVKSSNKNQERILTKVKNEWKIIKGGKSSAVSWAEGIKSLIKNNFTIDFLCLADSEKENISSIHSIFAIKQKYEEKFQERKIQEAQNKFHQDTFKLNQIYSKPLKSFWLCENCSFPNSFTKNCELCGSASSK